ncbi:hypothetical protein GCM10010329_69410 [Streptomyces spiroverticillatus]|nr:hypothetical protein GCM10010329_69410 [Streptomyces spiroverticillatus]
MRGGDGHPATACNAGTLYRTREAGLRYTQVLAGPDWEAGVTGDL